MKAFTLPLTIIAVGIAWLLASHATLPTLAWAVSLGLALAGLSCFAFLGFNTVTFVVGNFLIAGSVFSLLRQAEKISANLEPMLFILLGLLMVLAQVLPIPRPSWVTEEDFRNDELDC